MSASPPRPDADIVEQVVGAYLRRSRYARVIPEDLRQEAHAAIATARRTYTIERGDWNGYAYRAAWLALASFLVSEASPVTRKEKGARNDARRVSDTFLFNFGAVTNRPALAGQMKEAFRECETFMLAPNVEDVVGTAEWDAVVRERVLVVCRGDLDIVRILMEETTPAEVAATRGIPVSRIYNAVAGARARLSDDLELYSLMCTKNGVHMGESGGERE